jgi:peptidoglycan hydrolase FlgJ
VTTAPLSSTGAARVAAAPSADSPELAKLKKTAQAFEAVFIRQMIGSMRTASLGDGVFDSDATKQFQDMSDAKTAEAMAGKGALGIADMLVKQYGARLAPSATAATANAAPSGSTPAETKVAK